MTFSRFLDPFSFADRFVYYGIFLSHPVFAITLSWVGFCMILMEKNPSKSFFPVLVFLFVHISFLCSILLFSIPSAYNFKLLFNIFLVFFPLLSSDLPTLVFPFLYALAFSALLFLIKTNVFLIKLSFSIKRHHFVNNIFLLLNGCSKYDYL